MLRYKLFDLIFKRKNILIIEYNQLIFFNNIKYIKMHGNSPLPEWHQQYLEHYNYYNVGVIDKDYMKIQFIPHNNQYTVENHMTMLKWMQETVKTGGYEVKLLNQSESGFELSHRYYYYNKIENYDFQIRCNFESEVKNDTESDLIILPDSIKYNPTGINIFELTAYRYIPRKLMLYLYKYIEDQKHLIINTQYFPHKDDEVIWCTKSLWCDTKMKGY